MNDDDTFQILPEGTLGTLETPSNEDSRYRLFGIALLVGLVAGGGFLVFLLNVTSGSVSDDVTVAHDRRSGPQISYSRLVMSHSKYLDTIYTTDSIYLEVNLRRQNVTVRWRDGRSRMFRISSGNKYIADGIATPTGIFTVQNKVPLAISKQFNDAKLHHWIGIQGGVGFHGLDGNGYYGTLGVRPSSHGCVRMAREEIKEMYSMVHSGALIAVHDGDPARVIAFCSIKDTVGARVIDTLAVHDRSLGRDRLRSIMEGTAWVAPRPRLVHLARQRFRWGMPIGAASAIPKQRLPNKLEGVVSPPSVAFADRTGTDVRRPWEVSSQSASDSADVLNDREWEQEQQVDPRN